ncbi:hypothetical protein LLW22_04095 [Enterococcus casseliflavus]|nr:hypothetical protein LLW22_04095 [Enterococcus casseliflavus]
MESVVKKAEYLQYFRQMLFKLNKDTRELEDYLNYQLEQLDKLIEEVTCENFWKTIHEVIGVDAKLFLTIELIKLDELSIEEIIRITEQDYRNFYKELCGYDLSKDKGVSIVFNAL